jgi:hypothetical protein
MSDSAHDLSQLLGERRCALDGGCGQRADTPLRYRPPVGTSTRAEEGPSSSAPLASVPRRGSGATEQPSRGDALRVIDSPGHT